MSKKKFIILFFSIVIIYLIYTNKYLITLTFDYFVAPKDTIVKEESLDSLDNDKSLEVFLIDAEKKRESEVDIEKEDKKPEKEETTPNTDLEQQIVERIPLEDIKVKYMKDFSALETSFKNNIDSLIGNALSDYNSGQFSKMDIAKKYLNQGEVLEENSDKTFYFLLEQMKQELKSNQHPINIIEDIKTYYEDYKKTEKNRLVDKGMSIVEKD